MRTRYAKWTVLSRGQRPCYLFCLCYCGEIHEVYGPNLYSGKTKSCCGAIRHRYSYDSRYNAYIGMIHRCYNPKREDYYLYGERGIRVCRRWRNSVQNFMNDMGPKPSKKHSIDRINVNGSYTPKNCRWATPRQQALNTRRGNALRKIDTIDKAT